MTNTLLTVICRDLGIPDTRPADAAGYGIWSGTGRAMLTALWDTRGNEQTVSIQHCKRAGLRFLEAMADLCPDADQLLPAEPAAAVDEIYRIYRRNGLLYQQGDRCAPSMVASAGNKSIRLRRGLSPMEPAFMSGLGFWDRTVPASGSVSELFQLQTIPLGDYLEQIQAEGEYHPWRHWEVHPEFLRRDFLRKPSFWKDYPDVFMDTSLARYLKDFRLTYVLCSVRAYSHDAKELVIPEWRMLDPRLEVGEGESMEYLRLANALMLRWGTRPPIRYITYWDTKGKPSSILVNLGYPLPPTEQDFFLLYGWPSEPRYPLSYQSQLARIMQPDVFHLFQSQLQPLGYSFRAL